MLASQVVDGIKILRWDNPPVNAISADLRSAIHDEVLKARDDGAIRAIALVGSERGFSVGADISEFGGARKGPPIADIAAALERVGKPSLAVIHRYALGGGFEVALGCTYRVASRNAKVGLPEVKLGLLASGGGLQRLPRLIGMANALPILLSGREIGSVEALGLGLIDAEFESEFGADQIRGFFDRAASADARPIGSRPMPSDEASLELLRKNEMKLRADRRSTKAQMQIVECLKKSIGEDIDAATAADRQAFSALQDGDESLALRHIFKAERRARSGGSSEMGRPVRQSLVMGAGTMGVGIAIALARAGIAVRLFDVADAARERARRRIDQYVARQLEKGGPDAAGISVISDRIVLADSLHDGPAPQLVVEAIVEDLGLKKQIFTQLGQAFDPDTILASNTSYLDIDAMADCAPNPARILGLHFFSPAEIMPLVEVVRCGRTHPEALATVLGVVRQMGKQPVVTGHCYGFAANRSRAPMMNESRLLVEEGASVEEVDRALEAFGFPMGPFRANDLAGIDVYVKALGSAPASASPGRRSTLPEMMCAAGRLGQKTRRGWYLYDENGRSPTADPELEPMLDRFRKDHEISARKFSSDEILFRCLYAAVNEIGRIVAEGIVDSPDDMDVIWTSGFAFPRTKGGPVQWARQHGLARIAREIETNFRPFDPARWPQCDLETLLSGN